AVDEARVDAAQVVVAELLAIHHAGPEVLDEHVGVAHQAWSELPPARLADVDANAALVAVQTLKIEPADMGRQATGAVGVPDAVTASGLLHLDHIGAHVAEQRRAPWPRGLMGHVDDADAVERPAPVRCVG